MDSGRKKTQLPVDFQVAKKKGAFLWKGQLLSLKKRDRKQKNKAFQEDMEFRKIATQLQDIYFTLTHLNQIFLTSLSAGWFVFQLETSAHVSSLYQNHPLHHF